MSNVLPFGGYHPAREAFAKIPMEVVHDESLTILEHCTLLILAALIGFEQFKAKVGRLIPVAIAWSVIAESLQLSEDGAKDRVAALESLGRLRVHQGPPQLTGGHGSGFNLFVIRWDGEEQTDRLTSRVIRRANDVRRLAQGRTASKPLQARTPSAQREPAMSQPFDPGPRRIPLNQGESQCFQEEINEKSTTEKKQSVRQYPDSSVSPTDGLTDRFSASVLEQLFMELDGCQVPHVAAGPFSSVDVGLILESFKVGGKNLRNRPGTLYNALTDRAKGAPWLARAPKVVVTPPRPAQPTPTPAVRCDCPEAAAIWAALLPRLESSLPESTFHEHILRCSPQGLQGLVLLVRAVSPSAGAWITQDLAEDLYEAAQGVGIPGLQVKFI